MRRSGVTPPEDACMLSLLHVHYPTFTPSNLWRGVAASSYTSRFACDINSIYVYTYRLQSRPRGAGAIILVVDGWSVTCLLYRSDAFWLDLGCAFTWRRLKHPRKLLANAAHC
jgi:hypothetical protein